VQFFLLDFNFKKIKTIVGESDPFGPPGSGFCYRQAKIVRKNLISHVLRLLYDYLSLKNYVNVASKSNKQKTW
jgi:hypothetical protein